MAGADLNPASLFEAITAVVEESWCPLVLLRIRTKDNVGLSEALEYLGGDEETGLILEAYCVGEMDKENIRAFMREREFPRRLQIVLLRWAAIESMEVCPIIKELGILIKRKEFYTAAEIAEALNISVEEVEVRAAEEDWPVQEHPVQ